MVSFRFLRGGPLHAVLGETKVIYHPFTEVFRRVSIDIYVAQLADPIDVGNVIAHELGHALGLGHTETLGDLMYPNYNVEAVNYPLYPSTLDVYGVSRAFGWLTDISTPTLTMYLNRQPCQRRYHTNR